jgi:glycosyltransferase involved in cell wall biosynthesis
MQHPKVSVLMPIYNVERYLEECLDSACAQTLSDIEIICINDGSTDSSKAVVERYMQNDARIKLIDKANSGYGASMNQGLDAATGEYIAILESDDFLDTEGLATLYEVMRANDVQVVKANYVNYWTDPSKPDVFVETVTQAMTGRVVNPQEEYFPYHMAPSLWTALFDRKFLVDNNIRFLETPGASFQDTSFNFKVWAAATRVVFIYEAFLHYRQDNEASSVNSKEKAFCVCEEYYEMERYLDAHPEKNYLKGHYLVKKFYTYLWNYTRLGDDLRPLFLERIIEEFSENERRGEMDLPGVHAEMKQDWALLRNDPQLFHAQMSNPGTGGLFSSLRHYFKVGGVPLVWRAIRNKLKRSA